MRSKKVRQTLVTERKYEGKYVAFDPTKGKTIIASGGNPANVIREARERGVSVPAVVFVPKEGVAYIY